jgi:hypothetical protein
MITIASLVNLLIWLLVLGIVVGLVFWVLETIPVPQPLNKIIRVAAVVIVVLIVILLLLQLAGVPTVISLPSTTS